MLKAYMVFPGDDPFDQGCVLTFAKSRNEARAFTVNYGPWIGITYLEMNASRIKRFDKHALTDGPEIFETNEELPEPFFCWNED